MERICGCALFDKVWKWKDDQKSPTACVGLVQFFYQFAREIDKGEVSKVIFEGHANTVSSNRNKLYPYNNRSLKTSSKKATLRPKPDDTVEMYCSHNDYVTVALFVTGAYPGAEELADMLVKTFTKQNKLTLDTLKPQFTELAKNPDQSLIDLSFLPRFATFEDSVNRLSIRS